MAGGSAAFEIAYIDLLAIAYEIHHETSNLLYVETADDTGNACTTIATLTFADFCVYVATASKASFVFPFDSIVATAVYYVCDTTNASFGSGGSPQSLAVLHGTRGAGSGGAHRPHGEPPRPGSGGAHQTGGQRVGSGED